MSKGRRLKRATIVVVVLACTAGLAVFGYTYLHPFNRYRRAAMGWVSEHNAIIEASDALIEEYRGRSSSDGLKEDYREQILDRWLALQADVEDYDAPPELAKSHECMREAIREQTAASRALLEESGSGQYAAHMEKALDALLEYQEVFVQERRDWIGK